MIFLTVSFTVSAAGKYLKIDANQTTFEDSSQADYQTGTAIGVPVGSRNGSFDFGGQVKYAKVPYDDYTIPIFGTVSDQSITTTTYGAHIRGYLSGFMLN
jgi:hypothetical protein